MIRERPLSGLTDFQRDLLVSVSVNDGEDGQTVKRDLEEIRGEETSHQRLYDNLDELAASGLIHKHYSPTGNEYLLADRGAEQLENERRWITDVVQD